MERIERIVSNDEIFQMIVVDEFNELIKENDIPSNKVLYLAKNITLQYIEAVGGVFDVIFPVVMLYIGSIV